MTGRYSMVDDVRLLEELARVEKAILMEMSAAQAALFPLKTGSS